MSESDRDPSAPDDDEREILTWSRFGDAARQLAQQVIDSGWFPDVVVAVARGGILPAGAVAYALGVKAMGIMNAEFHSGIGPSVTQPVLLPPLVDASALAGTHVLVVDDVADSGRTLAMVMEAVAGFGTATRPTEARSAVVYVKPSSVIAPDFAWRATSRWITFPWSALPPVSSLVPQEETDAGAQQP